MIRQIAIENFQSHKKTILKLDPGVNVIVGPSDKGKSAAIRAVLWVIENRPLGTAFVSDWAKEKKKKKIELTDTCEVQIELDDGRLIGRVRSNEENKYYIDDVDLDAPKTSIPDEISLALNIGDVNIGRQMDAPFLISSSSGEAARFLNQVIHMEIIDETMKFAEQHRRKVQTQIEQITIEIKEISEYISTYDWIEDAEPLVEIYTVIVNKKIDIKSQITELENQIDDYTEKKAKIASVQDWVNAEDLVHMLDIIQEQFEGLELTIENIKIEITTYKRYEKQLPDFDVDKALKLAHELKKVQIEKTSIEEDKDSIIEFIKFHKTEMKKLREITTEVIDLEKRLPNQCPWCKTKLTKEHLHALINHK